MSSAAILQVVLISFCMLYTFAYFLANTVIHGLDG
jgi:hypothetical protein